MPRPDLATLLADLRAEGDLLDELLRSLSAQDWERLTPAEGWTVRHQVAHLAVAARDYAFTQRRLDPPAEPFRVELTSADEIWTWGPADAAQRVHGAALDFALLATRRRHRQDCAVTAAGRDAEAWLDIVQAYAGPPGPGREPLPSSG